MDTVLDNLQQRGGLDSVALCATYHDARDVFPHNPLFHIYRHQGDIAWFNPEKSRYRSGLVPRKADAAGAADLLSDLCQRAGRRGMAVDAWTIFLHNSVLGAEHPDCVTRNVYGDPYLSDLCPAHPRVRAYCCELAGDIATRYPVRRLLAESLHYRPLEHGEHHERYLIHLPAQARTLLSLCFCPHCREVGAGFGVAVESLALAVRNALEPVWAGELAAGDPPIALPADAQAELDAYVDARGAVVASLVAEVRESMRPSTVQLSFIDHAGAMSHVMAGTSADDEVTASSRKLGIALPAVVDACDEMCVLGYVDTPQRLQAAARQLRPGAGAAGEIHGGAAPTAARLPQRREPQREGRGRAGFGGRGHGLLPLRHDAAEPPRLDPARPGARTGGPLRAGRGKKGITLKILLTGAAGHVATLALPGLQGHELRLADVRAPAALPAGASFHAMSVLDADDGEMAQLFRGVETVVHSAYIRSAERDVYSVSPPQLDRFEAEFQNIRMAQRVYRCALEAGVRRVVVVSSNHAADWYEHNQVHQRRRETVYPTDYPLADNFYGWSKASYELLAYPYACGTFGRRMEFVMLRIGSPYPIDPSAVRAGRPARRVRITATARQRGVQARAGRLAQRPRLRGAVWLRGRGEACPARRRGALGDRLRHLRQHARILVARVGPAGAGLRAAGRLGSRPRRGRAPAAPRPRWRRGRSPGARGAMSLLSSRPRAFRFPFAPRALLSSRGCSMLRRFLLSTLVFAAAALALPALAAYPEKPIRLIVPSAPGGAPDALMRALAQQMSLQMGVPIVIDNKPGGSYMIGTMELVHAAPDGYTLAYGNVVSLATNRSLLANVPYDVDKDLTLISNALQAVQPDDRQQQPAGQKPCRS